jgi:peroxiredoxin (alkyl hydroperoxide reductase subunit C)
MSDVAPLSLPRLNEPAPSFEASSTHGPLKLEQYKGRWVVLFSHPADFTPVCSTEFAAFAQKQSEFQRLNTQLIGLSIDSVYSHIAWVRTLEEKLKIKVGFPVIADLDMQVAHRYGMVHPGASSTATVRCVFLIDPKQVVRAMIYYPLSNGRNIDEILRLLEALQTTDAKKVATPANWRKGDKVIVPPPTTQADAETRMKAGFECLDWFFCKRDEPQDSAPGA